MEEKKNQITNKSFGIIKYDTRQITESSYPIVRLFSASEFSESLSELETITSSDPMAFSNSNFNLCKRLGEQQQHCQQEACASDKYASPRLLFTQVLQNNVLHDLQLTKSLLCPHHPQ